jgi:hypothetical protein
MRRDVVSCCTIVVAVATAGVVASPAAASSSARAAAASVCTPGTWVQDSVHVLPAQRGGTLYAAAVATPSLAWAVGTYENSSASGSLIEKWTGGSTWSVVGTGARNEALYDVAAFGADSAFAVGTFTSGGTNGTYQPLVMHWNGSTWTRTVLSSPPGNIEATLLSVSGSSASDVWAVGFYDLHGQHLLVEHWNGSKWSRIANPAGAQARGEPTDVVAVGTGDMWMDGFTPSDVYRLWQYTGTWTLEPAPPASGAMTGTSDTNLWMIGSLTSTGTPLEHYNGSTWSAVDNTGDQSVGLVGIALGASPSTVWTVGSTASSRPLKVYIARNGVEATVPAVNGALNGIGTGSGLAFAVGSTMGSGRSQPIVMASCD